jgi:hypothetical protein
MAIIPGGQQIRTSSADVDLTPRGNSLVQAQNKVYTMDDIVETVNAEAGDSYTLLTGFWQYDQGDLEQTDPTVTILQNTTGVTITASRQSSGYYQFTFSGGGVTGNGHLLSKEVVSSGSNSRLIASSLNESAGNITGMIFFAYAPGNTSTGLDTNGEKIYFEFRVY